MIRLEKVNNIMKSITVAVFLILIVNPVIGEDRKESEIRNFAGKYMQEYIVKQPLCLNPQSEEFKNFEKKYYAKNPIFFPGGGRHYVIDTYHFGSLKKKDGEYLLEILFDVKGFLNKGKIIYKKEKLTRLLGIIYENNELKISFEYDGFFFPESCPAVSRPKVDP